jgi:hypothetical protein
MLNWALSESISPDGQFRDDLGFLIQSVKLIIMGCRF